MFSEEIVYEIDSTLDKLIENAEAMKSVPLIKEELDAFQKTQESLLAHLISMDELLKSKKEELKTPIVAQNTITEKLSKFQKLNANFIKNASQKLKLIKVRKSKKLIG
ncbi:MAG: hypothetical protein WCT85_02165 [Parachlamydiales bacterium]